MKACHVANLQIMSCIAIGLGLPPNYFDKTVQTEANALRLFHYPSVPKTNPNRAGYMKYIRTMAVSQCYFKMIVVAYRFVKLEIFAKKNLFFKQVMRTDGEFIDVKPIPNTIIVNICIITNRYNMITY